ncbi:flagellar biosynthetic protein FliR [uncultured Selenomonas sp.]|uniref:flagellar biosynthetic protein FliR n=1 Tax=uncultured Selenomonas sp. TaxID=159275 RepID=UPI0025D4BE4E|nr:flagellar biosynthetic protein FliR [uncultured Selenomonas sp.]
MDLFTLLQDHAAVFLLLLTRTSGLFMIAPFFGSMNIPMQVRAGASLAFAVVLFPVVDGLSTVAAPTTLLAYTAAVIAELFVGWLIGFVAYVCFSAIHMAGKVMDMQVGFAVVNVMDPTSGQQIPLIGSFLYNLSIIVFLVTNGHHMLITALAESFHLVPLMTMQPNLSLSMIMVNFVYGVFVTGMKVAMPVTFAILLVNVSLGILARTMPQLNIFVVGIPMQLMVGVGVLAMLLPFYVMFLGGMFDEMHGKISIALQALQ